MAVKCAILSYSVKYTVKHGQTVSHNAQEIAKREPVRVGF